MHAPVAALLLTLSPTPSDLAAARADLQAPPEAPAFLAQSPRAKLAYLLAMREAGAIDADATEAGWFRGYCWESDVGHARRLVDAVRGCPAEWEGDGWLPSCATAGALAKLSADDAERLRVRLAWEPDRAAELERAVRACDELAVVWNAVACAQSRPGAWNRPRRVVLGELRDVLGEHWEAKTWPPQAAWWALTPR